MNLLKLFKNNSNKQIPFKCPYDTKGRSCPYVDSLSMTLSKKCKDCERYNNGVRPSKF